MQRDLRAGGPLKNAGASPVLAFAGASTGRQGFPDSTTPGRGENRAGGPRCAWRQYRAQLTWTGFRGSGTHE